MHDSENSFTEGEKLCVVIDSVEPTPSGCVKITTPSGSIFLLRDFYLENSSVSDYYPGLELSSDDMRSFEMLVSTLCCVVEGKALDYLNRSEHSRFSLEQKLIKKGYGKSEIEKALDYLESENLLSDKRFALAWLRTRRITKAEGRTKLLSELLTRGVDKKTAVESLDEFFDEFSEQELLEKAFYKLNKNGISDEALFQKLMNKGFSVSMIKKIFKEKK